MEKALKSRADRMFASSQKASDRLLKEKQKLLQDSLEKTARLRAMRLAQEPTEQVMAKAPRARKKTVNRKSY
jgi:hypothetical protein